MSSFKGAIINTHISPVFTSLCTANGRSADVCMTEVYLNILCISFAILTNYCLDQSLLWKIKWYWLLIKWYWRHMPKSIVFLFVGHGRLRSCQSYEIVLRVRTKPRMAWTLLSVCAYCSSIQIFAMPMKHVARVALQSSSHAMYRMSAVMAPTATMLAHVVCLCWCGNLVYAVLLFSPLICAT